MGGLPERVVRRMPQYYKPPENWSERGKISIVYRPWWRNVIFLRGLPFWVGNRVKFHVQAEKPSTPHGFATNNVQEYLNDNLVQVFSMHLQDADVVSQPIFSEGNLRFCFGYLNMNNPSDPLILTAHILNFDRRWIGCASLVVGAVATFIVTLAAGIVTGALDIDKFWHVINPWLK